MVLGKGGGDGIGDCLLQLQKIGGVGNGIKGGVLEMM